MGAVVAIVIIFLSLGAALGAVAFVVYRRQLRRAKGIERGLKMVPVIIHLPPPSDDTEGGSRDIREVMREKTSQAEVLYNLIAGTATTGFKSNFYGQRHVALELIATGGLIHFYAAVPVALVSLVEQAILTAYPGARLEEAEDHNIFNQEGRIAATMGGEIMLKNNAAYPIATFKQLERDPMEAILNTLGGLEAGDGAGIQIMLRPADPGWVRRSVKLAAKRAKAIHMSATGFTAKDFAMAAIRPPEHSDPSKPRDLTALEKEAIQAIEEKTQHTGYETLIRVVVSTASVARSQSLLRDLSTSFALFDSPGLNGFKFLPAVDSQGLVTAFIFRFFPPEVTSTILNSVELATLYHLPDKQFTPTAGLERQQSKQVDGPTTTVRDGLLFGYNEFRGVRKEIRLSPNDRRRHTYILGQTGTGKSTMLENLIVQDMRSGGGFAFIDPHGDTAEKLMSMVPKERAEDVVYFNPADTEYPLGLNLFEFDRPEQKDFLIQETIGMLTKLYDPNGTGVIGPRFEQWYRNAALTLMADPAGSTFIEIPKVFSDTEYLKRKFRYLKDPTVIEFWTKEMGQTSDYHKSEMLGYFVSKFGAFQQNEMMRNIIGQTKSAFNIREIMDNKKILIINLSKGSVGELNSRLLGMMFVIKIQAAAMSRADMPEIDRKDFSLYVDEFQNFSTDSFASILSEARKYRLNLIVANQFIGQLSNEIRDAVFGNVGTMIAHRMGPEDAEFMVKQFAPVFDTRDLVNIPNYHSVMRLMVGGLPSQPFSMADLAPIGNVNLELGKAMMQLSAAKFGVSRAQVEADIFGRLSGKIGATTAAPMTSPQPAPVQAPAPVPAPSAGSDSSATPVPASAGSDAAVTSTGNVASVETQDPNRLSFKDITGGKPVVPAEPEPEPEAATVPLPKPVAEPEPIVVPEPVVPAPAPLPEPVVVPNPVQAVAPAPAPVLPEPTPEPIVAPAPAPAPEPVAIIPAAPISVPVNPDSVIIPNSVVPMPPAPVVAPIPPETVADERFVPSPTTTVTVVEPELGAVAIPKASTPRTEDSSIHAVPLIPETPIAVLAPTPEPASRPAPKINTEHHAMHPQGRPEPKRTEPLKVEPTPAHPAVVPAPPKVGRPDHTVTHAEGRPEPVVIVTPTAEPVVEAPPAPKPEPKPAKMKPRERAAAHLDTAVATTKDQVERKVTIPDTHVPQSAEEAQAEIEKIIDPDHHLHLFPEPIPKGKVLDIDAAAAELELKPVVTTPEPEPVAAPAPTPVPAPVLKPSPTIAQITP